jgi:hypothetical protein
MRRTRHLAVAGLALLALSGCVGSEARLSHKEYEREMQAIADIRTAGYYIGDNDDWG